MITSLFIEKGYVQKHCRRQSIASIPIHIGYRDNLARFLDGLFRAFVHYQKRKICTYLGLLKNDETNK